MGKYVNVPEFFRSVYLVDLSPSLLSIARARFEKLGWSNVKLICIDCRDFDLRDYEDPLDKETEDAAGADLITMSYSLTMIPEFYPVVDFAVSLLAKSGIIAVVDFYAQSQVEYRGRNYAGGFFERHCSWLNRTFWRAWFDLDRVWLDTGRRDYLEYRFGTRLSLNQRNAMLPGLRIPYYIWIGCSKEASSTELETPFLHERAKIKHSNLPLPSVWYQNDNRRTYYDERLPKYTQFKDESVSALTWDDSYADASVLSIQPDDVILAPTGTGDNILCFSLQKPKYIHAVGLDPAQNHLLELKISAFQTLDYEEVWTLLGEGKHASFRKLLMDQLSPHMSSQAFQFWMSHGPRVFTGQGLFCNGGSRRDLNLAKQLLFLTGRNSSVRRLAEAQTLDEQKAIWDQSIRSVVLNQSLYSLFKSRKQWPWTMPKYQHVMIEKDVTSDHQYSGDDALWKYVVSTLDPVMASTSLGVDNHYYLACLLGKYTRRCCPDHLKPEGFAELSKAHAFDGLRISTDEMSEVIAQTSPGTLTIAVVADMMDRLDPEGADADTTIRAMNKALSIGGRVLLKSVGLEPWYISKFEQFGFRAQCHGLRQPGTCIDR